MINGEKSRRRLAWGRGIWTWGAVYSCCCKSAKRETMRVIQIPLNGGRRLIGINKKDRRRRWVYKKKIWNLHKLKNIYTPVLTMNGDPEELSLIFFYPFSIFYKKLNRVKSAPSFFPDRIESTVHFVKFGTGWLPIKTHMNNDYRHFDIHSDTQSGGPCWVEVKWCCYIIRR